MKEYSKTEIENGIDEWIIGKNGKRNRLILKLKLIDGLSYTEIANELSSVLFEFLSLSLIPSISIFYQICTKYYKIFYNN